MKYSLHIGLNAVDPQKYGGWTGRLAACENDAKDMASLCAGRGYLTRTLLTKAATLIVVWNEITRLASIAMSGDTVLITFSGHGGQVSDGTGDENDKLDETICLYDAMPSDDFIKSKLSEFKTGVNVITVFDSCNSGTATRDAALAAKIKAAPEFACSVAGAFLANKTNAAASFLHIAACKDGAYSLDGDRNGLFTGSFLQATKAAGNEATWKGVVKAARELCAPHQVPNYSTSGKYKKGYSATFL